MTLAVEVLHFIEENGAPWAYWMADGDSRKTPSVSWQDVVLHFHPEAAALDADGKPCSVGPLTPREVLSRHAPSLPPEALPATWPAEDELNFLLDIGTLYEPVLGTVALIPGAVA